MADAGKYGKVKIDGVPDDEPVFVLRAKDDQALDTIRVYHEISMQNDRPAEFVQNVEKVIDAFETFRHQHAYAMQAPD